MIAAALLNALTRCGKRDIYYASAINPSEFLFGKETVPHRAVFSRKRPPLVIGSYGKMKLCRAELLH